ncbi:MAG: ABC transporter ATP-binding protein [Desulfosalsimonadaceae bacterium]
MSFNLRKGQSIAVLGPNGAGKTTLVEMIEGIQKPDTGEIRILGKKWRGNEDELHRAIGLCLQETRFIDKLTVRETLRMFAAFYDLDASRVNEILEITGLSARKNAYAVNLSGGQRQRLALGLSLINRPQILLLDEPTTGLDPNARREIWSLLLDLKKGSGISLILTTHYMEEAENLCDYIMIMDQGRVLKEGTLESLLAQDSGEKVIEFKLAAHEKPLEAWELERLAAESPFPLRFSGSGRGEISLSRMEEELPRFLEFLAKKQLQVKNLECRRRTLDDLFTSLTGRKLYEQAV